MGVASNSFSPPRGTNSEITNTNAMVFSSKKFRNISYLCNKYGYGFRHFFDDFLIDDLEDRKRYFANSCRGPFQVLAP